MSEGLRRLAAGVGAWYGGGVLVFLAARTVDGGYLPPVTLLRQFSHLVLALCVPLLAAELLRRRWLPAGALAIGAAVFVGTFGGRLVADSPSRAPGEGALRVMTINAGDERSKAASLSALLRGSGADLIAIQELGEHHVEEVRALADLYPHQVLHALGIPGMGLLSKRPLEDVALLELKSRHPYLLATLEVDGRAVRILDVHPRAWIAPFGRLSGEADDLLTLRDLLDDAGPAIVLGDLNSTDQSWAWRVFDEAGLVDGWLEAGEGFGFTFPVFLRWRYVPLPPILRVDYVWHTRDLETVSIEVGRPCGSDHLPLVAELAWTR